jgi:hypothetical protein
LREGGVINSILWGRGYDFWTAYEPPVIHCSTLKRTFRYSSRCKYGHLKPVIHHKMYTNFSSMILSLYFCLALQYGRCCHFSLLPLSDFFRCGRW